MIPDEVAARLAEEVRGRDASAEGLMAEVPESHPRAPTPILYRLGA